MDTEKNVKKPLDAFKKWYEDLGEEERGKVGVVSIVGDMNANVNHSLILGEADNLIMTIAQQMVLDSDFRKTINAAVKLVEEFVRNDDSNKKDSRRSKFFS